MRGRWTTAVAHRAPEYGMTERATLPYAEYGEAQMNRSRRGIGACLLLLGLSASAACHRNKGQLEPKEVPAPAPAARAALDGAEAERRLALLPARDATPADAAITAMQERVRNNPEKLEHLITLGQAWVRKAREAADPGYYKNADACAALALRMQPDSPLGLNLRALVLLNDHRFAEAQAVAEGILARSGFNPMALGTLSDALLEQGRIDAAEEAAQKMLAQKPGLPSYSRASYLYFLRGNGTAAKQAIRLAIDSAPTARADAEPRAWAIVQAAQLFLLEGDYEGADAGFAMALRDFADYPPALVGRAQVALAQERYRDAVPLLEAAYRRSPLAETAWLLGDARRKAGDAEGAAAAYRELVQKGRRTDPRTVALYLATESRELDEATALIERERHGRNDLYTQDVHALVLLRSGRAAEARAAIDAVLKVGVRDPRILHHAALIHAATDDKDGARRLAAEALRISPRFDVSGADSARALLASLGGQVTPAPLAVR